MLNPTPESSKNQTHPNFILGRVYLMILKKSQFKEQNQCQYKVDEEERKPEDGGLPSFPVGNNEYEGAKDE